MKQKNSRIFVVVLLAAAATLGLFTISSSGAPTFQDVDKTQWYYDSIHKVADEKIMSGVSESLFEPNADTTRAMLATVLWRANGSESSADIIQRGWTPKEFSDLTQDWYREAVDVLSATEKVQGYPDGTFRPDREVTRAEAAVMIANSLDARGMFLDNEVKSFMDQDKIPEWAAQGVKECQRTGILSGYTDGSFRPNQTITRAELAKMLAAFLDLPVHTVPPAGGSYQPNAVTDQLIQKVVGDSQANYLISPLSLKVAFAMAANGAEGETRNEIVQSLGLHSLEEFNAYIKDLKKKYTAAADAITIDLNNSIWVNEDQALGFEFKPDYQKLLDKYYDAEAGVVNDETAVKTINDWISEKTRGKIPQCISSNEFTSALVNTLYFKGAWAESFGKGATRKGTFTNADGQKVQTDLMHMTESVQYYQDGTTQMIRLPYDKASYEKDEEIGGDKIKSYFSDMNIAMYVVLSEEPVQIASLIDRANGAMENHRIVITLPKFSYRCNMSLNDPLQALGIRKAFTDDAEFSAMSELPQKISQVLQSTFIAVDEEGTEAAAATVISMEATSAMPEEPYAEFTADRPFQFAIVDDKSGEVLFAGAYNQVE